MDSKTEFHFYFKLQCRANKSVKGKGDTQVSTHFLPKGFLACEGEWEINSIQGHPIDLSFPSGPVPPHRGVTDGANVLVVPEP